MQVPIEIMNSESYGGARLLASMPAFVFLLFLVYFIFDFILMTNFIMILLIDSHVYREKAGKRELNLPLSFSLWQ